jgi:ATP-dependent Lon protease
VRADDLGEILGPPRYFSDVAGRRPEVGVATGLAWTPTGGEILFVEARAMPGNGRLELTGQVGDVMRESALAAMSYIRANTETLGVDPGRIADNDVHVHVPAGAVKKDGPSAGVAIASALLSLLRGAPLRHDVAMTGEITLRGKVLPVGGIKEKVLAAHRAGMQSVVLPILNKKDVSEIPEEIRNDLELTFASTAKEAFQVAFSGSSAHAEPTLPPPGSDPVEPTTAWTTA